MNNDLLADIRARDWFYRFELPDGSTTDSYLPESALAVHDTRLDMMRRGLEPVLREAGTTLTGLDLASHQGWFSFHLAEMGVGPITGLEPRQEHIDDATLMARAKGLEPMRFVRSTIQDIASTDIEPADVVLMLGLLYHLENPVAAIRTARAYCRKVCLIETQVAPHLSGQLDWGSYEFVRPIKGSFAVIDETDETHGPETGVGGICLAPSIETLLWIMTKAGFRDVGLIAPPEDGYEQHRHKKRVMAIGHV